MHPKASPYLVPIWSWRSDQARLGEPWWTGVLPA